MLATLLVPWPRPRLSSDRAAIASPSRCCLLISNASCGLGGFGCAAHAVRKMSLPSPQSRRTYAGSRGWSLDRQQRPMHVLTIADFCNKICQKRTHALQQTTCNVSLDQLVGRHKRGLRHGEAQQPGCLTVDDELELGRLLNR